MHYSSIRKEGCVRLLLCLVLNRRQIQKCSSPKKIKHFIIWSVKEYDIHFFLISLGLSWILGYFAISDARLPFQYAFTILSSLQGFFIFVLFVARKKQVREQWKMICCCIYPDQQKAQRTLSASASYPSTCSSRSTSSTSTLHHQGRTDRSDSCKTTTSFIGSEYDSIYTVPYSRASRDSLYYRKL